MIKFLLTTIVAVIFIAGFNAWLEPVSSKYARSKVVQLLGSEGRCSGEQVVAPSGVTYILTAGHCVGLKGNKTSITVKTEDGKTLERQVIAEDAYSDLLLLEGLPATAGLKVAKSYSPTQRVRTLTHGAGLPTYETQGVLVGKLRNYVNLGFMGTTYVGTCSGPKYSIVHWDTGRGVIRVCVLDVIQTATTAMVVPGSSGGMAIDDNGDLIGVVSATDGRFSYFVSLEDIRSFLSNY